MPPVSPSVIVFYYNNIYTYEIEHAAVALIFLYICERGRLHLFCAKLTRRLVVCIFWPCINNSYCQRFSLFTANHYGSQCFKIKINR